MKNSIIVLATLLFSSLSFADGHHIVNHLKSSMHNIQMSSSDSKDIFIYGGKDLKPRLSAMGHVA